MKPIEILALVILTLTWGTVYTVAGYTIRFFPSVLLYSMRFLIAGICLIPFTKFSKLEFKKIFLFGTFQAFTFLGIALALKHIDSSISAIIMRLDIPITLLIASFMFKEKITWNLIVGCFMCFGAIYIISGDMEKKSNIIFVFLVLFSAILSAASHITSKTINKKTPFNLINAESCLIVGLELLVISFFLKEDIVGSIATANTKVWLLLIYLSIVPSIIGFQCLHFLMRRVPTNKTMVYGFLRPFLNVVSASLLLGEVLSSEKILALILTTAGIGLSQINFTKTKFRFFRRNQKEEIEKIANSTE